MATEEVQGWLKVVDDDLKQVVNNLRGPMPSRSGAAYHCQQAAEKLVKLYLCREVLPSRKPTILPLWSDCYPTIIA